jgi:hypothetical protein
MILRKLAGVFVFLLSAGLPIVLADSWAPPQPRVFAATWGSHGFKVLEPKFGGPSHGVLFTLDDKGKEKMLWELKLVNTPHRVLIADNGKHVVTIDTYGSVGQAHAVVLYGDKGKVLCDLTLENFLSKEEIGKHVLQTVSSRMWAGKTQFAFDNTHFIMRMNWGKMVRIELKTGKIS